MRAYRRNYLYCLLIIIIRVNGEPYDILLRLPSGPHHYVSACHRCPCCPEHVLIRCRDLPGSRLVRRIRRWKLLPHSIDHIQLLHHLLALLTCGASLLRIRIPLLSRHSSIMYGTVDSALKCADMVISVNLS